MADHSLQSIVELHYEEQVDSQNESLFSFPEEKSSITLLSVNPGLGFIEWQVSKDTVSEFKRRFGKLFNSNKILIRVYDATGINFNGYNARKEYDIQSADLIGCYYLKIKNVECKLMVEIGFVLTDGKFVCCARSNTMEFNNLHKIDQSGLYSSCSFNRTYTAQLAASSNNQSHSTATEKQNGVAVFFNESALSSNSEIEGPVSLFLSTVFPFCRGKNATVEIFSSKEPISLELKRMALVDRVFNISMRSLKDFHESHMQHPFRCIQCHDWYSVPAAIVASYANRLPLITVFHSLEIERAAQLKVPVSRKIESWERRAIEMSEQVIVTGDSAKKIVVEHYGKNAEQVVVIADSMISAENRMVPQCLPYNIDASEPFLLFAGELSPYTGADLIVEALPGICKEFSRCQFVFAGDGKMKGELEKRAWDLGIGQRCRFLGDVKSDQFQIILEACYAVLIPSRIKHGDDLARLARDAAKQIVATHQAALNEVVHGVNGYLVYDNPGSICWGIKEVLSRPLAIQNTTREKNTFSPQKTAELFLEQWEKIGEKGADQYKERVFSGKEYNILSII